MKKEVHESCAIQQCTGCVADTRIDNCLFSKLTNKTRHTLRTDHSTEEINLILCWRLQNVVEEAPCCYLTLVGLSFPFSCSHKVKQVDGCNDAKHHLPLTGGTISVIYTEEKKSGFWL